jgi:hypothetical protein
MHMATFDYLPCLQDLNNTSINSLYVHYFEQIYVYSIVFSNNMYVHLRILFVHYGAK